MAYSSQGSHTGQLDFYSVEQLSRCDLLRLIPLLGGFATTTKICTGGGSRQARAQALPRSPQAVVVAMVV